MYRFVLATLASVRRDERDDPPCLKRRKCLAGGYEDALSSAEVAMRAHSNYCLDLLLQAMEIMLPSLYLNTMSFVTKAGEASIPVA